jgi:hypothetical protein
VSSYWRLPSEKLRNQAISLLDADTGRVMNARLDYVGPGQVMVGGQPTNCSHFRVTGGAQVELWYDAQERLVRQEWVEDGHKAMLELTRIQR